MFHQKTDGIAAFSATEAFINFLGRGNGKRRGLFIVKRAEAQVAVAPFFEFHKRAHNFYNIYAALNLLYGFLADQVVKLAIIRLKKKATVKVKIRPKDGMVYEKQPTKRVEMCINQYL